MKRRRLGKSGIVVTEICMGTMTFGAQADEAESHRILDKAYDAGIDFYDLAEMYPVPPKAETFGVTEEFFGRWAKDKPRDSLILATKITGPGHGWFRPPVRHGMTAVDGHQIRRAVDASLKRLQTDYIDLFQIHWPDHGMPYEEVLTALDDEKRKGKIRVAGCSNETCWGVMKSLWEADKIGSLRYESVQNNFSLINRRCENELAQVCRKEGISLLPYSPLGGGVLSGKYNSGSFPADARFSDYLENGMERQKMMAKRFVNDRTIEVSHRINQIAQEAGISPVTLSVAWSKQHDFVASTIIGVSALNQLDECLKAADLSLSDEVMLKLDAIEVEIPNPMTEDGLRKL